MCVLHFTVGNHALPYREDLPDVPEEKVVPIYHYTEQRQADYATFVVWLW